jgi:uncharacterized protein (UPF0276 family)
VAAEAAVAERAVPRDRVGLGWRGELAAGIFSYLARIDLLEVIADDYFRAGPRDLRALTTLAGQVPITLHGVAMGLASSEPVETSRLDKMARLVDSLHPESWSEHLAFVRAGGIEIGHLAAPPRTSANVDAAARNIAAATRVVGRAPVMENIATLIDPPGSSLDEVEWITGILQASGAPLLLDLHNLYANALNFGESPAALMLRMPLHLVRSVHLSGGKWIAEPGDAGRQRLLDDHVHDVPADVFDLLALLAQHAPQPLDVIIERDGNYPDFARLLIQLEAARTALRAGRVAAAGALMKVAA